MGIFDRLLISDTEVSMLKYIVEENIENDEGIIEMDHLQIIRKIKDKYCNQKKCSDCEINFRNRVKNVPLEMNCSRYYAYLNNIKIKGDR